MRLALPRPVPALAALVALMPAAQAGLTFGQGVLLGDGRGAPPIAVACFDDDNLFVLTDGAPCVKRPEEKGRATRQHGIPAKLFHYRPLDAGRRTWSWTQVLTLAPGAIGLQRGPGHSLLVVELNGDAELLRLEPEGQSWRKAGRTQVLDQNLREAMKLAGTPLTGFAADAVDSVYLAYGQRILRYRENHEGLSSLAWLTGREAAPAESKATSEAAGVDLEHGPAALAAAPGGGLYRVDRGDGSILWFAPKAKEPVKTTPDWGIPGFRPQDAAAVGDDLLVTGTTPGNGRELSLVRLTASGPGQNAAQGVATPLDLNLGEASAICPTPRGHVLHADPLESQAVLWLMDGAGPVRALESKAVQPVLPPESLALQDRKDAQGPAQPPSAWDAPRRPSEPLNPVLGDQQAALAEALAGFVGSYRASAQVGDWLEGNRTRGARSRFTLAGLLAEGDRAQSLEPPSILPQGDRRFGFKDEKFIPQVVGWMLASAGLANGATGREKPEEALPPGLLKLWRWGSDGEILMEITNLQEIAPRIDRFWRNDLVTRELKASEGIVGLREHKQRVHFAYGLSIKLDRAGQNLLAITPAGLLARTHEWVEPVERKYENPVQTQASTPLASFRSLASPPSDLESIGTELSSAASESAAAWASSTSSPSLDSGQILPPQPAWNGAFLQAPFLGSMPALVNVTYVPVFVPAMALAPAAKPQPLQIPAAPAWPSALEDLGDGPIG